MTFLSLWLPQFKCRSWFFRPKRVSFLHCQCCRSLASSHSTSITFTQSLICVALRHSLRDMLRRRDWDAQRNCCSLAWGSQTATVTEVALSTFMHLLWFSLKMRKVPLSEEEEIKVNKASHITYNIHPQITYLCQRWCRGFAGDRGPQQNLNKEAWSSVCGLHSVLDEAEGESPSH